MLEDINGWTEPDNLEAAYEQLRISRATIRDIETQLGDRIRRQQFATPMEYAKWRRSANIRLNNELQRLRLLHSWIRRSRQQELTG